MMCIDEAFKDVRISQQHTDYSPCLDGSALPGSHQFHLPSKRIVAGTSRVRMIVASTSTATVIPRPISLEARMEVKVNAPVTITKSRAALVITPPVFSRPRATAQREDFVVHREAEEDAEQ